MAPRPNSCRSLILANLADRCTCLQQSTRNNENPQHLTQVRSNRRRADQGGEKLTEIVPSFSCLETPNEAQGHSVTLGIRSSTIESSALQRSQLSSICQPRKRLLTEERTFCTRDLLINLLIDVAFSGTTVLCITIRTALLEEKIVWCRAIESGVVLSSLVSCYRAWHSMRVHPRWPWNASDSEHTCTVTNSP